MCYPDDHAAAYHHRLLLRRVGASWISCSPDHELEFLGSCVHPVIALAQEAPVPRRVLGDIYLFDDFESSEQLEELCREAARMASRLGGETVAIAEGQASDVVLVSHDTARPRFADLVMEETATSSATAPHRGLRAGLEFGGRRRVDTFMERVSRSDIATFREQE